MDHFRGPRGTLSTLVVADFGTLRARRDRRWGHLFASPGRNVGGLPGARQQVVERPVNLLAAEALLHLRIHLERRPRVLVADDAHALAPPDADLPARLSALSEAAAEQAAAFELAAQGGLGWRSRSIDGEFRLAPELTPGMTRPGRQELWDRFDGAVAGLAAALSGSSLHELTAAFSELADVSGVLASELRQSWRPARVG